MPKPRGLRSIVSAIADGTSIDWVSAEAGARNPAERELVQRLRSIAGMAHPRLDPDVRDVPAAGPMRLAYAAMVALAGAKTALAFAAGVVLLVEAAVPATRVWPTLLNLTAFGAAGGALTFGGARDRRSRRLGMFFFVIASAFADRLLTPFAGSGPVALAVAIATRLATDAFLGVGLWLFVWEFPFAPRRPTDRYLNRRFLRVALAVGVLLFAASAVPLLYAAGVTLPPMVTAVAAFLDRRAPSSSYYWPLLFCTLAPALPYLLWKSRLESAEDRGRAGAFVLAFIAGLTPMIMAVIVSPFVPYFDSPANRDRIGMFLYAALLSIIPMTAYAVRVGRVMNIDLIITAAMRHSAIRSCVWLAGIGPIGLMVEYTYVNRHLTVLQLLSTGQLLLLLPLLGVAALTFRHQILQAIERRLMGEPRGYLHVLASLKQALQDAQGVRHVVTILTRELESAFQTKAVEVLVLDETGRTLATTNAAVRPLRLDSTLGDLVRQAREEIYAGVEASAPVRRLLPEDDRRWLTDHGFQILVPLTASGGDLLGIIALGERPNRPGFSTEDRLLLSMMASYGTMILENRSLRDLPYRHLIDPARRSWRRIDWDDEPGALCTVCRLVSPATQVTCGCGSATVPAALPLLLRGRLRVERFLGSGGMGVVYLATDIALNRRVAAKTIPSLTPGRVQRLEREARAMASVLHPNLAMIFDVESWRGAPVLIVEYLEGGTLADTLARTNLDVAETIELGLILADVLVQMHAANVLHRDIKPSNIGYARDGAPKLMDFGVAHALDLPAMTSLADAAHALEPPIGAAASCSVARTSVDHVIGTPLYLSPEALGGADLDCSFDLWSLGLTLFEAVSGVHPFRADAVEQVLINVTHAAIPDVRALVPGCPDDLAHFFADALARDVRRRPSTAAEFRNRLSRIRRDLQRS